MTPYLVALLTQVSKQLYDISAKQDQILFKLEELRNISLTNRQIVLNNFSNSQVRQGGIEMSGTVSATHDIVSGDEKIAGDSNSGTIQ